MTDLAALADELERLEKQATEGPWCWDNRGEKGDDIQLGIAVLKNGKRLVGHFDDEGAIYVDHVAEIHGGSGDAALICALVNAAPQLIEAVRELGRVRAAAIRTVDELTTGRASKPQEPTTPSPELCNEWMSLSPRHCKLSKGHAGDHATEAGITIARLRSELTAAREREKRMRGALERVVGACEGRGNHLGGPKYAVEIAYAVAESALTAPPPKSNEGEKNEQASKAAEVSQSAHGQSIAAQAAPRSSEPGISAQSGLSARSGAHGSREAAVVTSHPHPAPTGEPNPHIGNPIDTDHWAATGEIRDLPLAQPAAAQGERTLCGKCDGNGVVKIRNGACQVIGTKVCPACNGDCYAAAVPPAKERGEAGEGLDGLPPATAMDRLLLMNKRREDKLGITELRATLAERDREVERLRKIAYIVPDLTYRERLAETSQRVRGLEGELNYMRDRLAGNLDYTGDEWRTKTATELCDAIDLDLGSEWERAERAEAERDEQRKTAGELRLSRDEEYTAKLRAQAERDQASNAWRAAEQECVRLRARVEAAGKLPSQWREHIPPGNSISIACAAALEAALGSNPSEPGKAQGSAGLDEGEKKDG